MTGNSFKSPDSIQILQMSVGAVRISSGVDGVHIANGSVVGPTPQESQQVDYQAVNVMYQQQQQIQPGINPQNSMHMVCSFCGCHYLLAGSFNVEGNRSKGLPLLIDTMFS